LVAIEACKYGLDDALFLDLVFLLRRRVFEVGFGLMDFVNCFLILLLDSC
jgi:hypothetical protein